MPAFRPSIRHQASGIRHLAFVMADLHITFKDIGPTTTLYITAYMFQLGTKFAGRSGGIRNAILISLTSEERRARPHISGSWDCKTVRRGHS